MPGQLTPLVLLPRYTSYAGKPSTGTLYFATIAMDVTEYSSAIVNVWRGKVVGGTTPGITFTLQESTDQLFWTTCTGTSAGFDPGENTEVQYNATLTKRWLRIIINLGGADNVASCWAVGFLEQRES